MEVWTSAEIHTLSNFCEPRGEAAGSRKQPTSQRTFGESGSKANDGWRITQRRS